MSEDTISEPDRAVGLEELEAIVRAVYTQNPSESSAWLATAAMLSTGSVQFATHSLAYLACHQTFEKIARAVAGGMDHDQIARMLSGEPDIYGEDDDSDALRARSAALARHADLLEAEGTERKSES